MWSSLCNKTKYSKNGERFPSGQQTAAWRFFMRQKCCWPFVQCGSRAYAVEKALLKANLHISFFTSQRARFQNVKMLCGLYALLILLIYFVIRSLKLLRGNMFIWRVCTGRREACLVQELTHLAMKSEI